MDEQMWLHSNDPQAMLEFLRTRGKASGRKLRLFAVACCRRIWPLLTDERSRRAVEVAERQADGLATEQELATACDVAAAAWGAAAYAADAAASLAGLDVVATAMLAADAAAYATEEQTDRERNAEEAEQCRLLQDILNPFRTVPVNPSCLTPTIVALAQALYDHRSFDRLPELAQALQDTGCHDAELQAHLRSPGPHVLGCWAVDAVLGKS